MLIRFWGTRGSLPASLNYLAVRSKIREALVAARGETLSSDQAIDAFIDRLPFPVRGTYGGKSSFVGLVTRAEGCLLCGLGSGVRGFGDPGLTRQGPRPPRHQHAFMRHFA